MATPKPQIRSCFATPVCVHFLPIAAEVNAELKPLILERAQANGTRSSRGQGWRSAPDFGSWGGNHAETLFRVVQEIANTLVNATTSPETRASRPVTVALVREFLMRQTPDGYARTCEALADATAVDPAQVNCPTLLVTGDADSIAPAQDVQRIGRAIAGSQVEVLRGCGHWSTIEKPDECRDLLRRFYLRRF